MRGALYPLALESKALPLLRDARARERLVAVRLAQLAVCFVEPPSSYPLPPVSHALGVEERRRHVVALLELRRGIAHARWYLEAAACFEPVQSLEGPVQDASALRFDLALHPGVLLLGRQVGERHYFHAPE